MQNIKKFWPLIAGAFLIVVAGVGAAWLISSKVINNNSVAGAAPGAKVTATEAGMLDPKITYQTATGILQEGGIGNEGTHHLEVGTNKQHWVYLTSSVIDLQSFVGKKVEIWGETLASKHTPWLMDVAKVQIQQ